jgi:hypothetical protein
MCTVYTSREREEDTEVREEIRAALEGVPAV